MLYDRSYVATDWKELLCFRNLILYTKYLTVCQYLPTINGTLMIFWKRCGSI